MLPDVRACLPRWTAAVEASVCYIDPLSRAARGLPAYSVRE